MMSRTPWFRSCIVSMVSCFQPRAAHITAAMILPSGVREDRPELKPNYWEEGWSLIESQTVYSDVVD